MHVLLYCGVGCAGRSRTMLLGVALLSFLSCIYGRLLHNGASNVTQGQPVLPVRDICSQDYPGIPFKWYPAEKVLALTFDDGPQLKPLSAVLDVLAAHQLQATFFVNTNMGRGEFKEFTSKPVQDLMKRLLAEGHELGSHASKHLKLTQQNNSRVEELLTTAIDALKPLTGDTVPLFRAPYGDGYDLVPNPPWTPEEAQRVWKIVGRHHVHVGWSFDGKDWSIGGSDPGCVDRLFNAYGPPLVEANVTGVVLMHSLKWSTGGCPQALHRLITYYKAAGYKFVKVSALVHQLYGMTPAEVVQRAQACS